MKQEAGRYFFGSPIYATREREYIQKILNKYKAERATEELKAKIWDELQMEKHLGRIKIPFTLVLRKGGEHFPDYIEILLDSKV